MSVGRRMLALLRESAPAEAELMGALKRVAKGGNSEPSPGSFRILKSVATVLSKMGLVDIAPGSEYRRSEWGRETGPVFVTALITTAGKEVVASGHFPKKKSSP